MAVATPVSYTVASGQRVYGGGFPLGVAGALSGGATLGELAASGDFSVVTTALTLTLSASSGTNGVAITVTVTPNGPIPTGGASVTLAASNGGVLGTTGLSFTAGSIAAQMTTLTRPTAGTSTVTMTNNIGLANNGSGVNFTTAAAAVVPPATNGTAGASLSSAAGATDEPVTFGLALVEGAFPSTSGIAVGGLTSAQVEIRNAWPDGSAKIVVVSGRCTVPAASAITASLTRGTAATGTALTETDLLNSGVNATLQFGGGTLMTLSALIGVAAVSDATGLTTNGRVRQLSSGQQMSSWLYAARLNAGNAHVIGWMEVRFYGGTKVHVLPWVENGFTRISGCAGQVGTLAFTMQGTTRFTAADVHVANHCRVYAQSTGLGHWAGAEPDVYAAPDPVYLQSTGLVPPYFLRDTSAATTRLNGLTQGYSPSVYGQLSTSPRDGGGNGTANGEFDAGMGAAGYHAGIGPLPEWDVFYLTSGGDQRARNAVIANAMGYGRYGVHFRDELTLAPVSPADVPNKTLPQGSNHNIADVGANQFGGSETLPTVAGYDTGGALGVIKPEYWAQTHHPSAGFLAYLLTGHEAFVELCQMTAATCFLRQSNVMRNYASGYQRGYRETTRGAAWALRTIFQAATISRDSTALQTGLATIAQNNIADYLASYVTSPCGSYGATRPYSNFNTNPAIAIYRVNGWELDFSVSAWGYGLAMKPPVGSTALTDMGSFFQWHAQWPVHRLGELANAGTYGFTCAARENSIAIAPAQTDAPWIGNVGPWYANPGEVFTDTHGASNSTNATNTIGVFASNNGSFPDATSYWANFQTALAFSVHHNVTGARDGYLRMVNASNWGSFDTSAATNPVGSLRAANSPPAWAAQLTANTFVELSGTQFYSWNAANLPAGAYRGTDPIGSPIDAFCDPAITTAGDQIIYGGGHGDGTNDGVVKFNAETLTYTYLKFPTLPSKYLPAYNRNIDHPDWANPVLYPSGLIWGSTVGVATPPTTFIEGTHQWHKGIPEGLDPVLDAAYATELGRASTHMYGSACMRGDVAHYFYLNYAEFNTKTGKWGGYGVSIGAQLFALQSNLEDKPLQQGTYAIYDDVTDRFFVTLQPGDNASGNRCGLLVFSPVTRTVESVHSFGINAVAPSSPLVKVGRKAWLFRKVQGTTYLDPYTFNRGLIFDLDTKTVVHFTIEGNPAATGSVTMSVSQETVPTIFDGSRIVRWNYDTTNKGTVHFIDPNQTPVGGTGTSGDPYRYVQTSRAISNAPSSITYAYTRWAYVPRANAILFIPRANVNYRALYLP